MPLTILREFLDSHNVGYIVISLARFHGAGNCRPRAYSGEGAGKNSYGQDGRFFGDGRSSCLVSCRSETT